jgi:hypothetical protein
MVLLVQEDPWALLVEGPIRKPNVAYMLDRTREAEEDTVEDIVP